MAVGIVGKVGWGMEVVGSSRWQLNQKTLGLGCEESRGRGMYTSPNGVGSELE